METTIITKGESSNSFPACAGEDRSPCCVLMRRILSWLIAACTVLCVPVQSIAAGNQIVGADTLEIVPKEISARQLMGSYYEIVVPTAPYAAAVEARVWSDANGRDDAVNYSAIKKGDATWSVPIDTSRHGGSNMSADVYADGEYIGGIRFWTPVPKSAGVLAIRRMGTIYSIMISNLPTAQHVRVPVWSTSGTQNDAVWYDARHTGSGVWCAIVQTTRHAGGTMMCQVYADEVLVGGTSFTAPRTVPTIQAQLCSGTRYNVVIKNLWGAADVQIPTWGAAGGQDDIIWYAAANTAPGTWTAQLNAANHDEGTIISHVYADGAALGKPLSVTRDFLTVRDETGQCTEAPNLSDLSRRKIGWGHGGPKDADGRPEAALDAQSVYGKYDAHFIMPYDDKIYLTFDEGYENGYTSKILDVLKEKQVKAVFFVTYPYIRQNPQLVQRMIDEGHKVGNHSTTHPSFPGVSTDQAFNEIMQVHRLMQAQFGYNMELFRLPSGEFCERDLALLDRLGYDTLFWSYAYADWDPAKQIGAGAALRKASSAVHPGALYLLHAVSRDNAQMLGDFIDYCRDCGYTLAQY